MKQYNVYWRFKGKEFLMMPWNVTKVNADTKKEATQQVKDNLENIKVIRVEVI